MEDAPTLERTAPAHYPKWVGLVLGLMLHGSAHVLSGQRSAGIQWFVALLVCRLAAAFLAAVPGRVPYTLGAGVMAAGFVLWAVMLKQSYRPVRRVGILGWASVLLIWATLGAVERAGVQQVVLPFKMPSQAMAPTLSGMRAVTSETEPIQKPTFRDWLVDGRQYIEVRAPGAGEVKGFSADPETPGIMVVTVGTSRVAVPQGVRLQVEAGQTLAQGDMIWRGFLTAGDQFFAERLSYRFRDPQRGDIVVFTADGIPALAPGRFYVKRVAGLPGECVRIDPPNLFVNDEPLLSPPIFERIASATNGYSGFQPAYSTNALLHMSDARVVLGPGEYFVVGDNTDNSLDSRHWGALPRTNIVARVTRVYWPFNRIDALPVTGR